MSNPAIRDLDQNVVRKHLDYDPVTGILTWKARPFNAFPDSRAANVWNAKYAGKEAGSLNAGGYLDVRLFKRLYRAHRLAWIHANGSPNGLQIDHLNGVRTDNRLVNLRPASQIENGRNQKMPVNNTSGVVGVCWDEQHHKWRSQISVGGKCRYLGLFEQLEDAVLARLEEERKLEFHPNHGAPIHVS